MSRIGRAPITIPSGVEVKIDGSVVSVKGPKGQLSQDIGKSIKCEMNDGKLVFTRPDDMKENRAKHGLYRALVNNMVIGVTAGFKRELVINGVGYKAAVNGNKLVPLHYGNSSKGNRQKSRRSDGGKHQSKT